MRRISVVGNFKLFLFIVSFLLVVLFAINESRADEIPESALVADYEQCVAEGTLGMTDIQKPFCLCVVISMKNNMTLKEHLLLTAEIISKMDNSGDITQQKALSIKMIRELSSTCFRRISEQMK